ncbi:GNAT family N-acetyltransferase [Dactylosporangium sp. AC04546]|uniref:GNAT family N-acetyltransferase n=1 Tax=Dactylosporangium sp. AC04546 TaxID=2862460 RepID=UPI001EDF7B20|nr:GNAT family N-acetyltransferase [Dactylosporangium sp. AC04546]WVK89711.1 GNAT family N-acetyltransferase [Dactylosporangium sp. AC04546]
MTIRPATRSDVPRIVALLADDALGAIRESPGDLGPYEAAFDAVAADPAQLLVVATTGDGEGDGEVVGTLQLTFIPGLARRGALRAQVEAVRVASSARGAGLGETLLRWAVQESRRRGAALVQLTSDAARPDAHRFYERLGFTATHVGFKLAL